MRKFFFTVWLMMVYFPNCISQQSLILEAAINQQILNGSVPDATIHKLISIYENNENHKKNDSLKVEIAYFLGNYACDTCIDFLIAHITDRFIYGDGISEWDQSSESACYTALIILSTDNSKKWTLMHPILNSLRENIKREWIIMKTTRILCSITNKDIAKSIIEFEITDNSVNLVTGLNSIYNQNLLNMLKQF
jgi:hypothetical protein